MPDDLFPATWTGRRAIVSFPGQIHEIRDYAFTAGETGGSPGLDRPGAS